MAELERLAGRPPRPHCWKTQSDHPRNTPFQKHESDVYAIRSLVWPQVVPGRWMKKMGRKEPVPVEAFHHFGYSHTTALRNSPRAASGNLNAC